MKKKKDSIFEFRFTGLSLIDKEENDNNKNNCNNKILFNGISTDVSTLITISNVRKINVVFFGPGIYMIDILDYTGFYVYESNDSNKFNNHHKIRKVNEI